MFDNDGYREEIWNNADEIRTALDEICDYVERREINGRFALQTISSSLDIIMKQVDRLYHRSYKTVESEREKNEVD